MGIINSPQANPRRASRPNTVPQSSVKRKLQDAGHIPCPGVCSGCTPRALSWGNAVSKDNPAPGSPGTGSFLVTRYWSSAPSVRFPLVRYRARKLWGIISLSQHVLLIIITSALHIAWHPQPDLALLSASQPYTCSLPHGLQTMQLLG